ncbi:MAG: peptide-methionine (S)-S-oxide reductase, partial [Hyphomicrobiales bacterium]|nr:peptide-methionine (S)-S-oxide reductase [Hyphomicrobiales bacterium]
MALPFRFALLGAAAASVIGLLSAGWLGAPARADEAPRLVPPPALDIPARGGKQTAIVAGGCFWGIQGVFQHVSGVSSAVSGYDGGDAGSAHYEMTSRGDTGHAETVRITFDPSEISYGRILQIFFSVAHDPTELNRQGPDEGTQYRSAV